MKYFLSSNDHENTYDVREVIPLEIFRVGMRQFAKAELNPPILHDSSQRTYSVVYLSGRHDLKIIDRYKYPIEVYVSVIDDDGSSFDESNINVISWARLYTDYDQATMRMPK
jgi:hypothetical protein